MKKLERLQFIERTHGAEFVNPYRVCYTPDDVKVAYYDLWMEHAKRETGIRTDFIKGSTQGFELPFGWNLIMQQGVEFATQHGKKFMYLFGFPNFQAEYNGVAMKISDEHALFEVNLIEFGIPQRHMYRNPENLRRYVVGPPGMHQWNGDWYRSYAPSDLAAWNFDVVYRQLWHHPENLLTFAAAYKTRRIVLW